MSRSITEEVVGILWLILAFVASGKSLVVAAIAGAFGIFALSAAVIFACKELRSRSEQHKDIGK